MSQTTAFLVFFLTLTMAGCGKPSSTLSAAARRHATLTDQAQTILTSRCAVCHSFANNVPQMISSGLIVPGKSASSPLYLRIASGSMPPGQPLTSADMAIMKQWIDEALAPTPVPTKVPTATAIPPTSIPPTSVPLPTIAPTAFPTGVPTFLPTSVPPTVIPPTTVPTLLPTTAPTIAPTAIPTSVQPTPSSGYTYYGGVKAILDAKCAVCHQNGGVDEVLLDDYNHVSPAVSLIGAYVTSKVMPPGQSTVDATPALDHGRYLTAAERTAILAWVQDGGPAGVPGSDTTSPPPIPVLPRVDASVQLAQPYTPLKGDDYETFTLPWNVAGESYVIGFESVPGPDVHHILIFSGSPKKVKGGIGGFLSGGLLKIGEYNILGFRSLLPYIPGIILDVITGKGIGGTGDAGGNAGGIAGMSLIGAFVPGIGAQIFAPGIGVKVPAGAQISLQIHYNTNHSPTGEASGPDQTTVRFMLAKSVQTQAKVLPIVNPVWMLKPKTMKIPAESTPIYSAVVDPFRLFDEFKGASKLRVFSAIAHMHLHGKRAALNVVDGKKRLGNLLYVPNYDFQFQMNYPYAQPIPLTRGQMIEGVCQWDNTTAGAPVLNGHPLPVVDMQWGEKTTDEMCLFGVYIAQ